jgi:hypothetical protein
MVTGYKAAHIVPEHEAIKGSALLRAAITVILSAAAVYAMIGAAPVADLSYQESLHRFIAASSTARMNTIGRPSIPQAGRAFRVGKRVYLLAALARESV